MHRFEGREGCRSRDDWSVNDVGRSGPVDRVGCRDPAVRFPAVVEEPTLDPRRGRCGMRPIFRRRRGANAIEFALTLPLFLFIVFATLDYGYLFAMQAMLDDAVVLSCREG